MIQKFLKGAARWVAPGFFIESHEPVATQNPLPEKNAGGRSFPMVDQYGNVMFQTSPGFIHRSGGKPAMVCHTGAIKFYEDGEPHRDGDKPATIWQDGIEEFYNRGAFIKTVRPR